MRPIIAFPLAALLIFGSYYTIMNEHEVNSWMSDQLQNLMQQETAITGLQENENWLVVIVEFPDATADVNSIRTAELLMQDSAPGYLDQISGGKTTLNYTVHDRIVMAKQNVAYYGQDANDRTDTNSEGEFMPAELAEEVARAVKDEIEWDQYDIDDDGWIDRFLIMTSTKGQEENAGASARIWSHYTTFPIPITVGDTKTLGHYTMSSLKTGSSGIGTTLHEMLHQMGAMDLYPAHSGVNTDWRGVGNWDIMASGNWNGGGTYPALPTTPSMELIGMPRATDLDLSWPASSANPCYGPTVDLQGMSEGGSGLKIQIGEEEFVFIEYRSNHGYDKRLPGHGILVTQQDLTVGDLDHNELNRDSNQPWLFVVEADGRQDILNGANDGDEGDVFGDGQSFGGEGIEIRNHDGELVHWTATVNMTGPSISFTAANCSPNFELNLPDHGATILNNGNLEFMAKSIGEDCLLTANLFSTDGRDVTLNPTQINSEWTHLSLSFSRDGQANSQSVITGNFVCNERVIDVEIDVLTLGRIPEVTHYTGVIEIEHESIVYLEIPSTGDSSQSYTVEVGGALERIASADQRIVLTGQDDTLILNIKPLGLVTPGMIVNGEITLVSSSGHRWTSTVEFSGEDTEITSWRAYLTPARGIAIALGLFALIIISSSLEGKKEVVVEKQPQQVQHVHPVQQVHPNQDYYNDPAIWDHNQR